MNEFAECKQESDGLLPPSEQEKSLAAAIARAFALIPALNPDLSLCAALLSIKP